MTLTDLRSRAWYFLEDDGTRWLAADLINLLNEAENDVARRTRLLRSWSLLTADATQTPATAFYLLPVKAFDLLQAENAGRPLYLTTPAEAALYVATDWAAIEGTPHSYLFGPYGATEAGRLLMRVYPKPAAALTTLRGYCVSLPATPMAADTDTPEVPEALHIALVYHAVQFAYERDFDHRDPQKGERFGQLYQEALAGAAKGLST